MTNQEKPMCAGNEAACSNFESLGRAVDGTNKVTCLLDRFIRDIRCEEEEASATIKMALGSASPKTIIQSVDTELATQTVRIEERLKELIGDLMGVGVPALPETEEPKALCIVTVVEKIQNGVKLYSNAIDTIEAFKLVLLEQMDPVSDSMQGGIPVTKSLSEVILGSSKEIEESTERGVRLIENMYAELFGYNIA